MVWPAIIAAGAAVAGGILGNRASAGEASKQRDFAAEQYSKRYQITMADMRTAGLNPMLAYSQGPGTSPAGTAAQQGDFGGAAAASALSQMNLRKSDTNLKAQQANQSVSTAKNLDQDTKLKQIQSRKTSAEINKINQETSTEFQRGQHVGAQAALTTSQNRRIDHEIKQIAAKTQLTRDQQRLLKEDIERMIRTGSGHAGKTVDDFVKSFRSFGAWSAKSVYKLVEEIRKARGKK